MFYKLRDWIPKELINWKYLSCNPHNEAIKMLKENKDKINWNILSYNENPEIFDLIKDNDNLNINWHILSTHQSNEIINYRIKLYTEVINNWLNNIARKLIFLQYYLKTPTNIQKYE